MTTEPETSITPSGDQYRDWEETGAGENHPHGANDLDCSGLVVGGRWVDLGDAPHSHQREADQAYRADTLATGS